MNESYERSYYEIALTSTQALVGIGVLLACVGASFYAGLWVAGKADSEPQEVASTVSEGVLATQTAAQTAAPQTANKPAAQARTEPLSEPPADPPVEASSVAGGRRANNGGRAGTQVSPAREPEPPATTVASATPAQQPPALTASEPTNDRRRQAAADPAPTEPPRARVERSARNAPAEPAAGLPIIQVFSSSDEQQANALLARLRTAGYPAFLSPNEAEGRIHYRVRVGPFADRDAAEKQATELKRKFRVETWITTS
jgi:DedD protein